MMVLADGSTAGAAEVLGATLRLFQKAMVIGQPTAGAAVEYADLPLPSGKILRVAVGEVVLPEARPLFPTGLTPDLPVEMPEKDKREIFQASLTKGMSGFVFEAERPHLNEAALLAGTNPELETAQPTQRRSTPGETLHDPVIQRAVDLVTSLADLSKALNLLSLGDLARIAGQKVRDQIKWRPIESARETHRLQVPQFTSARRSADSSKSAARNETATFR